MHKNLRTLFTSLLLGSILLIAATGVNERSPRPGGPAGASVADGVPLPPPPHKKPNGAVIAADGLPLPPPQPAKKPKFQA